MKGRTTLGVAAGAVVLAAMAALPALQMTAPDARDDAAWIEVDDPPAETLALPPVQERITAPDPGVRRPPAPPLRTSGIRDGLDASLTVVPAAPPAADEPVPLALAEAGIGAEIARVVPALEIPALAVVLPPVPGAPGADGPAPDACCGSWRGSAC